MRPLFICAELTKKILPRNIRFCLLVPLWYFIQIWTRTRYKPHLTGFLHRHLPQSDRQTYQWRNMSGLSYSLSQSGSVLSLLPDRQGITARGWSTIFAQTKRRKYREFIKDSVHFNRSELHTGANRVLSGQMQGRTRITTLRTYVRIP